MRTYKVEFNLTDSAEDIEELKIFEIEEMVRLNIHYGFKLNNLKVEKVENNESTIRRN